MRNALLAVATVALVATMTWLALELLARHRAPSPELAIPSPAVARAELAARLATLARPRSGGGEARREVVLGEGDLERLALLALAEHADGRRLLAAARAIEAELGDGRLGLGVVLDVDRVAEAVAGDRERAFLEGAAKLLPLLGASTLFVGVEGRPRAEGGAIVVDRDLTVRAAFLEMGLDEVARRLDRDPDELASRLRLELPGHRVRALEVVPGELRVAF